MRHAALAFGVAMSGAGAWSACGTLASSEQDRATFDPGPTLGVEIAIAIRGRGRVVSTPAALDCPGQCFARITLADGSTDAAAEGTTLTAEASRGSHFVGFAYEDLVLGTRARGPVQCSPVTRSTTVLAPTTRPRLTLHYAETHGTPPRDFEAECRDFTAVPVAYALTATFEEDDAIPRPPTPPDPPVEALFEPPVLGKVVGREIGVVGGRVYWRFETNGASGIASGQADGTGGGSIVNVPPSDTISSFSVGRHVVFQHSSNYVEAIHGVTGQRMSLGYFSPCGSFASDEGEAHCRISSGGSQSYLYSWSLDGGSYVYLYTLPRGKALTLDGDRFYFEENQSGREGEAFIESAPRFRDGGNSAPIPEKLVFGQTAPRDLIVGPEHLFWIDDRDGIANVMTAPKGDAGSGEARPTLGARFIAIDPASPTRFWVGVSNGPDKGSSSIVEGSALSSTMTTFRSQLTGLGGLAVSATHVYWTGNDGRVYRAPKD